VTVPPQVISYNEKTGKFDDVNLAPGEVPPATPPMRSAPSSDEFFVWAKQVVCDNYNTHRNATKRPALEPRMINLLWYSMVSGVWRCQLTSPTLDGLIFEVTYFQARSVTRLEVYKKLNNVNIHH
jgi:hypothetical protein